MSDAATVAPGYCASCGVPDLGTRFCENCGAQLITSDGYQAPSTAPQASPVTTADVAGDVSAALRVFAVLAYSIGLVVSSFIYLAQSSSPLGGSGGTVQWSFTITAWVVAAFLLFAALAGPAATASKVTSVLSAVAYAVVITILEFDLLPTGFGPGAIYWTIGPVLLFACWAAGRGMRAGWWAIIAAGVLGILSLYVVSGFGAAAVVLHDGFLLVALTVVVQLANGFDGPKPGARRVNGTARTSIVLVLTIFLMNSLASYFSGGAATAWIITTYMVLIVALVLSHVGLVRARRHGQGGRGLAVTAMVLGYLVLAAAIYLFQWRF